MSPDDLQQRIQSYFREHADRFQLQKEAVRAVYVLNWGGFVNPSFTVTDQIRSYHVKVTADAETVQDLRRWHGLRDVLTARYRAPEVVAWLELPGGEQGLLFPHIPGHAPELARAPGLVTGAVELLARLHADEELRNRLQPAEYESCGEYFRATVGRCHREDLLFIRENRPPFVSPETLEWMEAQVEWLDAQTRSRGAFSCPADRPVHGDAWSNNLLVGEDGRWYLLDWDGLKLGDPMLEFAILLWPVVHGRDGVLPPEYAGLAPDEAARERLELYLRACLLDSVVDVLADWIDVDELPEHRDHVRAAHQATHERCLALYRRRYE